MHVTAFVVAAALAVSAVPAAAQRYNPSNPATERATQHYRAGWDLMRHEDWNEAAREFQAAIDSDAKYTLAYYGLGRANMPLRNYVAAIKAYTTCREQYIAQAGERFNNQFEADRKRQDEIMGLQEILRVNQSLPQSNAAQNSQRQIQNRIRQVKDRADRERGNFSLDASVPAFVSLALGSAYFRAERLVDAEREYKVALEADDQAGEAHNNLAVVYMLTGRLDECEREVRLAEKNGFRVSPAFKQDLADRRKP